MGIHATVTRIRVAAALASAVLALVATTPPQCHAQHPVDVQKLSAEGEHFKALTLFELLPTKKVGTDTRIFVAKSAWALGLNRQAGELFDVVLRDETISQEVRARVTLSRGAIEYQEGRYQEASLYAQKAVSLLHEPSPLRGRGYLLWGQALVRAGAFGTAEEKLKAALADADTEDKPEVYFTLATVEMRLGKYEAAEKNLRAIPLDHDRTPRAVRMLASVALETQSFQRARFWIERGKKDFPEGFIDSWADYGLVRASLAEGDMPKAREIVEQAGKQFAPSDSWLILMQAALEESEWERQQSLEAR
jgi:tetratricopeptide (TPR) repeat protein